MPFKGKHSCFSFTTHSIRQNAPPLSGVYALSNASEWLFLGESDNVQAALQGHLAAVGTPLRAAAPTGFTFELCDPAARCGRLSLLVDEFSPPYNPSRK